MRQTRRACARGAARHEVLRTLLAVAAAALLLAARPAAATSGYTTHVSSQAREHLADLLSHFPPRGDALGETPDALRAAWGRDLGLSAGGLLQALVPPPVTIVVDVKLVGFDGSGNGGLVVVPNDLVAHLRTLHSYIETVALHPSPRRLAVTPSIEFHVHAAPTPLSAKVTRELAAAVATGHASTDFTDAPLTLVDPNTVAAALEDDYLAHAGPDSRAYVIYLLNPSIRGPYAYSYDNERRSCPGGVYVSRQHRYAFYDISTNITFMGPGPGGRGQVLAHSVPALAHYRPAAARRAAPPDLAALAWSGVTQLVWPPLHHAGAGYAPAVAVHLIYMHQALLGAAPHVDRGRLEEELSAALKGVQEVSVHEHTRALGECPECVAGYSGALRVRTAQPHEKVEVARYLDLEALQSWLREYRDVVLSSLGITEAAGRDAGARVLPVFVFDVAGADTVLLDGWRQAAALPGGDVVAVRSGSQSVPTFHGCHAKQVHIDPSELHRPVLAALLQAGWGVSETAQSWSEATGSGWSWRWALGHTPFGPLSTASTLSFVQRDAMVRNMALSALDSSLSHASTLVEGFADALGPAASIKALLQADQVQPYNQRVALLLHKTHEACAALANLDFRTALAHALSTAHDVAALHAITRTARAGLDTELRCAGAGRHRRWWALPGGAAVVCVALMFWRAARSGGDDGRRAKKHAF